MYEANCEFVYCNQANNVEKIQKERELGLGPTKLNQAVLNQFGFFHNFCQNQTKSNCYIVIDLVVILK